ncbi:MAG: hypothetical protein CMJ81_07110 [Planctomycetaceae bacterium]|nr:hypothetical protein [Planctomycetaceae bacterium]MBP61237.1 hypothetical protein [Planctomycetaceae bacterium]
MSDNSFVWFDRTTCQSFPVPFERAGAFVQKTGRVEATDLQQPIDCSAGSQSLESTVISSRNPEEKKASHE